jgi:hypothetical protein
VHALYDSARNECEDACMFMKNPLGLNVLSIKIYEEMKKQKTEKYTYIGGLSSEY